MGRKECREAFICYKQEQSAVDRVWIGRTTLLAIDSNPVGKCLC